MSAGPVWVNLLAILLAYLIGSVSFAVLVSKAMGLADPHSYGSGNPGATNVLRTGRKAAAALTLFGDGAKGWLAVYLAQRYAAPDTVELAMACAAVAVVVGHMYPVFFRFQGGKGVSTALGALIALNIYLALGTAATWIVMAVFFRISSLAARERMEHRRIHVDRARVPQQVFREDAKRERKPRKSSEFARLRCGLQAVVTVRAVGESKLAFDVRQTGCGSHERPIRVSVPWSRLRILPRWRHTSSTAITRTPQK